MSTYNGEKYIKQQLDSIFAQEDVDVKLVVRDDGSKDSTLDILRQYNSIILFEGANIGCEKSFMELLFSLKHPAPDVAIIEGENQFIL